MLTDNFINYNKEVKISDEDRQNVQIAVAAMASGTTPSILLDAKGTPKPGNYEVNIADMLRTEDLLPLIGKSITEVLLNEIEPMSVIYDNFFQEVAATNISENLIIHSMGPLTVEPIGKYGEYPETTLSMDQDGTEINIRLQKYGLELRVHEDVIKENLLPVMSLFLSRARNAFVRNRERLAAQELQKTGIIVFDNNSPGDYDTGYTVKSYSGRGIDGVENGTMSAHDLMEVYVSALLEGFTIDTIGMHPFAWQTFMTDPEMKEMVINNNSVVSYRAPEGNGVSRFTQLQGPNNLGLPWGKGYGNNTLDPTLMKLGVDPYQRGLNALGTNYYIKPSYFPTPLKIVVSPFFGLSKVGNTMVTDIVFAQSGEAGIVLRDGGPIVKQIDVPLDEATAIRMREGLGFGTLNLGKAVRIAKNVVIDRNYVFQNTNSVSLDPLSPLTSKPPYA